MSNKSKSARENSLLAAIQREAPDSPAPTPPPRAVTAAHPKPVRRPSNRAAAASPPKDKGGKPVQFWLHDEDRRLVRELAAWLAGQGVRPTDSLVIRAALHTVKTGTEFLEAYRHASRLDGRLKAHKDESTQSHENV
jgi:hypothetical protein